MRGKRKSVEYVPEALEHFGKCLLAIRHPDNSKFKFFGAPLKLDGLQEAVKALNKSDRERIEKFWGLTGGPIHSKKMVHINAKDTAYSEMCSLAIQSLRKLLTLDYVIMYDPSLSRRIDLISKKFNHNGLEISDLECVKYLMAFFIYAENGPKMSFEEDPMSIDTDLNDNLLFDEYEVLNQVWEEVSKYPDESINLKLLVSFFEVMDFQDMLTIKKSIGIEIPKETLPEGFKPKYLEEIEIVRSISKIRELKEKVFPYGAWQVVSELILGNQGKKINLDNFMKELPAIRRDWAKVTEFKSGEKTLKTMHEIRLLNLYNIGGLEFTDPYEVMFLYLERNLIAPEV